MTTPEPQAGPVEEIHPTTDQTEQTQAPVEETENPAWNPVWEKFEKHPTLNGFAPRIKETLTPVFKEWDADRQRITQQYEPWKQFVEQKIEPDHVQNSLRLYQLMETQPEIVYNWLKDNPAIKAVIEKEMGQKVPEPSTEPEFSEEEAENPTIKALQQQVEELRQQTQQRNFEASVETHRKNLESGITQLQEAHSKSPLNWIPFNPGAIGLFLKEQMFDAQQSGRPFQPNLQGAYDKWAQQMASAATLQRTVAPRITPTNGGGSGLPLEQDDGRIKPEVAGARQSVFNDGAKNWLQGRARSGS